MDETTSVLFGLDDHRVLDVVRVAGRVVRVVIETLEREGACPACGVLSSRVKDRPLVRLRDLPASGQRVELWCRRRRLACREPACPRLSFTQVSVQVPARARLTARLREQLAQAIAGSNRAVAEVAAEHGVSWHTAHRALIAAAARWLPKPTPTRVLGIDETRTRTVRWILEDVGAHRVWRRSDPWMTSFVDADPTRAGLLLGLAPGRSGSCVRAWLGEQTPAFRDAVELVVIDPSAPYASGIRAALPRARIAVDKWHLVRLANEAVTEVRQRVTREQHGHRGTNEQPAWVHRRMLLTAGDRLSARQRARLRAVLASDDPTNEIGAAWAVKERLRMLLAQTDRDRIRDALWRFYDAAAAADMPETTRLASTIEAWWPAILVALTEDVTNARTEGFNRIIKQTKRVGCGFRNMDNYQRRIMSHIALTRARPEAAA
jgi:transposase